MTAATTLAPFASLWREMRSLRSRYEFCFSATGATAAALVGNPDNGVCVERWRLDGDKPRCEGLTPAPFMDNALTAGAGPAQALPFDDGSVLVAHGEAGSQILTSLPKGGGPATRIGVIDHGQARLLGAPDGSPRALVCSRGPQGESALWEVAGTSPTVRLVARFDALVLPNGGVVPGWGWVGDDHCAFSRLVDGSMRVVLADVRSGQLRVAPPVGGQGSDHVLLTAPAARRVLVASNAGGTHRLAVIDDAGRGGPQFPELAAEIEGAVTPLAFDPSGQRLLLHAERGLRSRLHVATLDSGQVEPLPTPEARVSGPAVWSGHDAAERVHCLLAAPSIPFEVLRLHPGAPGRWDRAGDDTSAARTHRWAPGRSVTFPGPAGDIEALVHGHEDWRDAPRLAIALHGGPERAWELRFDSALQTFASAGLTVIAPNQRGSVGYGREHQEAIRGRWGGPDLDDVLHLARHIRAERGRVHDGRLLLFGRSYGAYLALLAACTDAGLWERVAVVAPFASGARLYPDAAPPVRAMIERLGGNAGPQDEAPGDVLALLPRIKAPLLMMHGTSDNVVPVTQSHALRDRLLEAGRVEGRDFRYVEVPGAAHDAIDDSERLHHLLAAFLTEGDWDAPSVDAINSPLLKGGADH